MEPIVVMYYEPSELMREATVHFNILGIDAALRFAAESRIRRTDCLLVVFNNHRLPDCRYIVDTKVVRILPK